MVGIRECLKIAKFSENDKWHIICDNKASVDICTSIYNGKDYSKYAYNHLVTPLILELKGTQNLLQFTWVKGHAGFAPNEMADRLAKTAQQPIQQYQAVTRTHRCQSDLLFGNHKICNKSGIIEGLNEAITQLKDVLTLI